MSFDLMSFNNKKAPREKADFLSWYNQQTQWTEELDYNDPLNSTPELQAFFKELIETFPPMNGELSPCDDWSDDDWANLENYLTDYSIGRDVIYCAFAWSLAETAEQKMKALAKKHHVGYFGASTAGEIEYND